MSFLISNSTTHMPIWISSEGLLYVESSGWSNYYYTSGVGAIIAMIIILLILIFTVYKYINKDPDKKENGFIYIVFFIYCSAILIMTIQFAFVRSNIFTHQSPSKFTILQCQLSGTSCFILYNASQSCSFFLFIRRIQLAFNGTLYEYSPLLFKILYTVLFIATLLMFASDILGNSADWGLYYFDEDAQQIWCDVNYDEASSQQRLYGVIGTSIYRKRTSTEIQHFHHPALVQFRVILRTK